MNDKLVPAAGALEEWDRERRAGLRTVYDGDALWTAACYEARADEFLGEGLVKSANEDRIKAAEIILKAAGQLKA
jgi:hypothetical protein